MAWSRSPQNIIQDIASLTLDVLDLPSLTNEEAQALIEQASKLNNAVHHVGTKEPTTT